MLNSKQYVTKAGKRFATLCYNSVTKFPKKAVKIVIFLGKIATNHYQIMLHCPWPSSVQFTTLSYICCGYFLTWLPF